MRKHKDKMINKQKIRVETRRLVLRVLRSQDVTEGYVNGLNDPAVNDYLVTVKSHRQTFNGLRQYVANNWRDKSSILLGVFIKDDNRLIGSLRINGISYFHYLCHVGICIFDKRYWGKGYGSEALQSVVEFIFNELKLHYIEAGAYKDNKSSLRIFRKTGFRTITHLKDMFRHDNSFKECVVFGKVNSRFDPKLLK